jgi:hypothetical protein
LPLLDDTLPPSTAAVQRVLRDYGQFLILCEELREARVAQEVVQVIEVAVAKSFFLVSGFDDDQFASARN